jgi:nicotinamidase-related amidase
MSDLLVVVDCQEVFADPASPWAVPRFAEVAGPIAQLADAFGRVRFTRFTVPEQPAGSWRPYYRRWSFAAESEGAEARFALAAPFAGRADAAATLDRPTFSKWDGELARELGEGDELVLCGVATDCCVLATAVAAVDAGAQVRLVADACAGADDAAHERAVALLGAFAPQLEVTSVAAELAR